jgi:hypothetical protein
VIPHSSDDLCGIYIFGRRIDLRRDYVVAVLRTAILISVRDRSATIRNASLDPGPAHLGLTKPNLYCGTVSFATVTWGQRRWSPEPGPDGDLAARSRGTSITTWPVVSVNTVFARVPLRILPVPAPGGSCFS